MNKPEDRRKFARLNILVDVTYQKRDSAKQEMLTVTRNISKGGICFVGYEQLKENDIIDLNIYLPGKKEAIKAAGRVTWVKEFTIGDASKKRYDAGVEFTEINDKSLSELDKYMLYHLG
ncbi:MAG: PilZ domain-containing protein [Candidatus Omnitrophica bacterium]|nr:PilZ domain-containing protein [Candidatus Omnitrophota bacterium]